MRLVSIDWHISQTFALGYDYVWLVCFIWLRLLVYAWVVCILLLGNWSVHCLLVYRFLYRFFIFLDRGSRWRIPDEFLLEIVLFHQTTSLESNLIFTRKIQLTLIQLCLWKVKVQQTLIHAPSLLDIVLLLSIYNFWVWLWPVTSSNLFGYFTSIVHCLCTVHIPFFQDHLCLKMLKQVHGWLTLCPINLR